MSTSEHIQALTDESGDFRLGTDEQFPVMANQPGRYWDAPMNSQASSGNVRSIFQTARSTARQCKENQIILQQSVCGTHKAVTDEQAQRYSRRRSNDLQRANSREQAVSPPRPRKIEPAPGHPKTTLQYSSYKSIRSHAPHHSVCEQSTGGIYKTVEQRQLEHVISQQSARGTFKAIEACQGETIESGPVSSARIARSRDARLHLVSTRPQTMPEFERYGIIEMLSHSKTNTVYLAFDKSLQREVVLRVSPSDVSSQVGRGQKASYTVMDCLDAESVAQIVREDRHMMLAGFANSAALAVIVLMLTSIATLWAVASFAHLPY